VTPITLRDARAESWTVIESFCSLEAARPAGDGSPMCFSGSTRISGNWLFELNSFTAEDAEDHAEAAEWTHVAGGPLLMVILSVPCVPSATPAVRTPGSGMVIPATSRYSVKNLFSNLQPEPAVYSTYPPAGMELPAATSREPPSPDCVMSRIRLKPSAALALTLAIHPVSAGAQAADSEAAACTAQLEWASEWARENYSGYDDKVSAAPTAYDSLVTALHAEASVAATDGQCNPILGRWVAFFGDGHLSFGRPRAMSGAVQAGSSAEEVRARFADWPRVEIDEAGLRALLDATPERDPIEGIWESSDGSYRLAAQRDPDGGFVMSILRADSVWWMPGQIKARLAFEDGRYATRFYMRDHSEQAWSGVVTGSVLRFQHGSTWIREWPLGPGELSPAEYRAALNTRFHARELEPGAVLVQIPTFNDPAAIDSLFAAEGDLIRGADRLIVDVRGNGGGSDFNFRMLTPLVYTAPITLVGSMVLVTEANNRANEALIADTTWPAEQRRQMQTTLDRVKAGGQRWFVYEDRVLTEERPLDRPSKVAVIVDRGCASSCEQFLFVARQSAKTRIYGSNSAGILDYGNVRRADMPGSTLTLWHPTTRTRRIDLGQGIDGVGLEPHERIPDDVIDQIGWVLERMR
jgi:hypothetical protein